MANELSPLLQVGKEGLTESLTRELDSSLESHELVKVRILQAAGIGRDSLASELSAATGSEVAQTIGNTVLLYRAAKKPVIELH